MLTHNCCLLKSPALSTHGTPQLVFTYLYIPFKNAFTIDQPDRAIYTVSYILKHNHKNILSFYSYMYSLSTIFLYLMEDIHTRYLDSSHRSCSNFDHKSRNPQLVKTLHSLGSGSTQWCLPGALHTEISHNTQPLPAQKRSIVHHYCMNTESNWPLRRSTAHCQQL